MATKKFQNFIGKVFTLSQHQVVVEDLIAEGGFAYVFLVKSTRSEDRFALKRLYVNNKQDLAVCKRELNISRRLSGHRNIVAYVDSSITSVNSDVYEVLLLLQYCQGRVISQMADKQPTGGFSESEVLRIFCDVCEAVAHLHNNQPPIIHRDIKVENVLQSAAGNYVLCDFGSAVFDTASDLNVHQIQEDLNRFTTLSYRSPEMVDLYSGKHIGTKSDIWALGCLLYRLCFCTLPFGESVLAIQRGLVTIPDNSPYSAHLHALIGYLLQVDCDVRPDIYQVSCVAFKLARRHRCPVPRKNNNPVPDISTLPVPPSESEQKQQSTRQSSTASRPAISRCPGAAAVPEIEGTAINPRPRPRATDATPKQLTAGQPSQQPVVLASTPIATPTLHQTSTQKENIFPIATPVAVSSNNSAVATTSSFETSLLSERRNDFQWEQMQQSDSHPESSSSLIDFDSATAVPSFGSMVGMMDGAAGTPVLIQNSQYMNYGTPWGPSPGGFARYPSANAMRYCTPPQLYAMPVPGGSMPGSLCGASGFNQFSQPYRYAPTGFVGPPMTGSNNELHLMQTDAGSTFGSKPPQQSLAATVMKHRRISSDTSSLRSLLPGANAQKLPSISSFGGDVRQSSSLHTSVKNQIDEQELFPTTAFAPSVVTQVSDWNPFAEDNFGSLSREAIIAQQLNHQSQTPGNGFASDLFDTRHKRSVSDASKLTIGITPSSMQSSSVSPLARR